MSEAETKSRNQVLGVLFLGVLMAALDIAIVGPALPAIQRAFQVDERALSWIFSIYVLFNLVSTPLMAKLSDRFGRRTIYVVDVSLFAIGSLVVALSASLPMMLLGRAIQGLGSGGIFPVASAVIGDTFPPEKRGSALGMIGAVFGIAFLLGPIVGGILLLFGWPWLFLVNLPLAALIIALSWRLLPATRPATPRPFDLAGMVLLGLSLASLAYGLNQIDTKQLGQSLSSLGVWPFLLLGLVLIPVLVLVEQRVADPVMQPRLFQLRQVSIASALAFGAGLAEAAVVFVPALLVLAFQVSNSTASFMLLPIVFAMAIGSPVSGRMLDKVGSRVVVLVGTGLMAIGLGLVGFFAISLTLFYISASLFGLGLSVLLGAALRYIMLNEAGPADRAAAQGLLTIFTSVGQLAGGVLIGGVVASSGGGVAGYTTAFLLVAGLMVVLTLLSLGLKSRQVEQETIRQPTVATQA